MRTYLFTTLLLITSSLAPAQDSNPLRMPVVPGRPVITVGPPAWLDREESFPPGKPAIHLRSEWIGAQWGCGHLSKAEIGNTDLDDDSVPRIRIAVHHTQGQFSKDQLKMSAEQSAAEVKTILCGIRNYHMSDNNSDGEAWSDIGYHYLIDWRGRVWQGRRVQKRGANVRDNNPGTIGVALMGSFDVQKPTDEQVRSLKGWLAYLVYTYKIPPTSIHGHHEFNSTSCPGKNLERYREYNEPYRASKATPLRRIRVALESLWDHMRRNRMVSRGPDPANAPAPTVLGSKDFALPVSFSFDGRP